MSWKTLWKYIPRTQSNLFLLLPEFYLFFWTLDSYFIYFVIGFFSCFCRHGDIKKVLRYDKYMGILGKKIIAKTEQKSGGEIAE